MIYPRISTISLLSTTTPKTTAETTTELYTKTGKKNKEGKNKDKVKGRFIISKRDFYLYYLDIESTTMWITRPQSTNSKYLNDINNARY